ncbi:heavy-metal-associated domain-containing protein [Cohnella sp.]|uniref:heavy-metal-associated domain-containing protein n=1 Tax=Cohnella sp. TaxID=1883426 RepID=UPI00356B17D4
MKKSKMTLFFVMILSFALIISACASQEKSANAVSTLITENMEKASFKVTGMYCASCPFVVKTAIQRVDGVKNVNIEGKSVTGTAEVEFDKSKTNIKTIKQSVLDLGYGVQ